jgi:hypothetical protein
MWVKFSAWTDAWHGLMQHGKERCGDPLRLQLLGKTGNRHREEPRIHPNAGLDPSLKIPMRCSSGHVIEHGRVQSGRSRTRPSNQPPERGPSRTMSASRRSTLSTTRSHRAVQWSPKATCSKPEVTVATRPIGPFPGGSPGSALGIGHKNFFPLCRFSLVDPDY